MVDAKNKDQLVSQLSSCISKDNYHGLTCSHLDYLRSLIKRLGLAVCNDTFISQMSQERRSAGLYCTSNE